MNMKWHCTKITEPHYLQRYLVGMVFTLVMMSVQARPFVDQADIDVASQPSSLRPVFGSEFETASDRALFPRDLALGGQSVRDFSLKSFVKLTHQRPPMYGREFLFDMDVFERELFASVSSVAMSGHSKDTDVTLLDTAALNVIVEVDTTSSSRASIPEPTTLMLVAVGMLGLILHRRRTDWAEH